MELSALESSKTRAQESVCPHCGRSVQSPRPAVAEIRDYRLSTTRLEPGERADGVVVFDRPNFKESTEKLFLQIAQADQVDRPVLIRLPFTPPISGDGK